MTPNPKPTSPCPPAAADRAARQVSCDSAHVLLGAMGELLSVGGARIEWAFEDEGNGPRSGPLRMQSIEWTAASRSLLGFDPDEPITARGAIRRVSSHQRHQLISTLRRSAGSMNGFRQTVQLSRQGGENAWIEITSAVQDNASGGCTMSLVFQNVSPQREREAELRREIRRKDQMAQMAGIGTWTVDLVTEALTWSDEVFHIHEMEPGPMPTVAEAVAFYGPEAAALVETQLGRLIRGEALYNLVLPITTAKGNRRQVQAVGELEHGPDGTPLKLIGSFRDVTVERVAEAKLRASEERFAFALEGAQDGLWDWNLRTNEVHFSSGWKQLIGYEDHEITNHYDEWAKRVTPEHQAKCHAALKACLDGVTPTYRCEFEMRHKDGSCRWILTRGSVVERDDTDQAVRMVGTHTDITEQVRLREELVAAKDAAEEAARVKSDFLATMSHEIRTPLNGILGLTQILVDSELNAEQAEYLGVIYRSGTALLEILNDILDLSRTEAGKVVLESAPFSPVECARSTLALLDHATSDKDDLTLEIRVDDDVPQEILGDQGRLRQVLLNLIGNAVKFTEKGSVQVFVSTLPGPDGRQDLMISVRDTGIGISREQAARLFDAFTQADSTTTRKFGGTGLGLSISRNLVHLMGGVIGCRPNLSGGSVFWIEFPIHLPSAQDAKGGPSAGDAALETAPAKKPHVLVVEDNPINQIVARRMLEKLGCTVVTVANGQQAVDSSGREFFDVLFMDCQMPVMDGYEATRAIRKREARLGGQPVPIVAMTANAMQSDEETCLAAGMDAYLSKPVLAEALEAALLRAVQPQRAA